MVSLFCISTDRCLIAAFRLANKEPLDLVRLKFLLFVVVVVVVVVVFSLSLSFRLLLFLIYFYDFSLLLATAACCHSVDTLQSLS